MVNFKDILNLFLILKAETQSFNLIPTKYSVLLFKTTVQQGPEFQCRKTVPP